MQLAWTESPLKEKLILKRKAILGPDGDDKTVKILYRSVTWVCLSEARSQIEIEADPRHREILLAHMKLDGANAKSVATLAVKVQEWTRQMLTRLDKEGAFIVQKCNNESKLHVYQSCRCAARDVRDCTIHVRAKRRCMQHALKSVTVSCRPWQTCACDFGTEVCESATCGYRH